MLGGVALQATTSTVSQFVVARMLGKANWSRLYNLRYLANLSSAGIGLIFGTIAAPLLITELAYPTQVSYYDSMIVKIYNLRGV
jgi:hypothetical protein